jgi:hypothetical protein
MCFKSVSEKKSKMADQAGRPADWEMAKENIQPLKQGRKMAKLANCLQVRFRRSTVADPHHFNSDSDHFFYFYRIRNRLYTLMRIRLRFFTLMRIRIQIQLS